MTRPKLGLRFKGLVRAWPAAARLALIAALAAAAAMLPAAGWAQKAAPAPAAATNKAEAPVITLDKGGSVVIVIENDAQRQKLLDALRNLPDKKAPPAAGAAAEIDGGFSLFDALGQRVTQTGRHLADLAQVVSDLPQITDWLGSQMRDPDKRGRWLRLIGKLIVILLAGTAAEMIVRWPLAKPRRSLEERDPGNVVIRLASVLLYTLLNAVPVAAFGLAAYSTLLVIVPDPTLRVVAMTLVYAYLFMRGAMILSRMVLMPATSSLRLPPIGGETANYLFIWARRFAATGIFGYFLAEAAVLLGLPMAGRDGLLRVVGLLLTVLAVVFVLQNRAVVSDWIRNGGRSLETRAGIGMHGLRRHLADIWHVLAILYIVAFYAVWAVGIEGGFDVMLRGTVATVVIFVVMQLAAAGLRRGVARAFALSDDVKRRFPALEVRANRYVPVVQTVLRWLVYVIGVIAILQAWGIDAVSLLQTSAGRSVLRAAVNIAAVLIISLLLWELLSTSIERYLNKTDDDGNAVERSARARTLLPLMRNVTLVILSTLVVLIVLSEVGVNIGPLLAGAGVVGLAIGFGSQKLVQDVITGAFILFEDSIAVGDVVEVGGLSGLVEALSIRSIRLRDLSGNVHTIPFSSVSTVTNMTKIFSFYVFNVGVAYREDTDEVVTVLKAISDEMRADPDYGPVILEPLEVLGVDAFADSAVMIKARIKTVPIKQWFVGREFNRRMKKRFDELGIEIPFPHTTLYFGEDKAGRAPPAYVRMMQDVERAAVPPEAPAPATAASEPSAPPAENPTSETPSPGDN